MIFLLDDAPAPITWADFLHLEFDAPTPAKAIDIADAEQAAAALIGLLSPSEREVVAQTILEGRTLEAAGAGLGVGRQRTHQLRDAGLMRLRRNPATRRILQELA